MKKILMKVREKKGSLTVEQIIWIIATVALVGLGTSFLASYINDAEQATVDPSGTVSLPAEP
jgi:hypothetical protein